jgi:hypothetical protein
MDPYICQFCSSDYADPKISRTIPHETQTNGVLGKLGTDCIRGLQAPGALWIQDLEAKVLSSTR